MTVSLAALAGDTFAAMNAMNDVCFPVARAAGIDAAVAAGLTPVKINYMT